MIFLIISAFTDFKERKIYLHIAVLFFIAGMLINIMKLNINLVDAICGMSIGFLLIGLSFITEEKIGKGDGIVFFVTGVYLGFFGNLLLLAMSVFLCACFSAGALIMKKADRNSRIPMIPFLIFPALYEIIMAGGL